MPTAKAVMSGCRLEMSDNAFEYVNSWQCMAPAEADAVRAFWIREQANVVGPEAVRRVQQAVMRVIDTDSGELAAISTAEPRTIPRLRQPMYYYRCFIGKAWRGRNLPRPLLHHSFDVLEQWSRQHGYPCIGVLLELENDGFARALQRACWRGWPGVDFVFIGCSRRGLDLRVSYFRGACLQKPR